MLWAVQQHSSKSIRTHYALQTLYVTNEISSCYNIRLIKKYIPHLIF